MSTVNLSARSSAALQPQKGVSYVTIGQLTVPKKEAATRASQGLVAAGVQSAALGPHKKRGRF